MVGLLADSCHWHAASWEDGTLARRPRKDDHLYAHGRHGVLVDRYGAYAYPAPHVAGDPLRWVCLYACTEIH